MSGKRIRIALSALLAPALLVLGLMVGAGSASAAPAPNVQDFLNQSRANGLNDAQARELQRQVDAYRAELGGTQVAANAIDFAGTGALFVPAPGENQTRIFSTAAPRTMSAVPASTTCYTGDFCAWQKSNKGGASLLKYKCNSPFNIPQTWINGRDGSYFNNQTNHAVAYFYSGTNGTGSVTHTSRAVEYSPTWVWGAAPVDRSVVACR